MKPYIYEKGKRYSKLTVIRRTTNGRRNTIRWICRCDCGKEKTVSGIKLRAGRTKSCGSIGCRSWLAFGQAAKNAALRNMTGNETLRGYPVEIDDDHAILLMESQCYYCGALPMNHSYTKGMHGDYLYNGIDRYDNEPYVKEENAVPCCFACNQGKSNKFTGDEFKAWRQRLGPTNYD